MYSKNNIFEDQLVSNSNKKSKNKSQIAANIQKTKLTRLASSHNDISKFEETDILQSFDEIDSVALGDHQKSLKATNLIELQDSKFESNHQSNHNTHQNNSDNLQVATKHTGRISQTQKIEEAENIKDTICEKTKIKHELFTTTHYRPNSLFKDIQTSIRQKERPTSILFTTTNNTVNSTPGLISSCRLSRHRNPLKNSRLIRPITLKDKKESITSSLNGYEYTIPEGPNRLSLLEIQKKLTTDTIQTAKTQESGLTTNIGLRFESSIIDINFEIQQFILSKQNPLAIHF